METGALGESREVLLDALYAEAKQVLSQSANQLRALQERLREAHGSDVQVWQHLSASTGEDPGAASANVARGRQLLSRLELAVRDLEQVWLFLERGGPLEREPAHPMAREEAGLDESIVQLIARHVLEAQEAERTRIAEELHDGPAQALANATFQVEVIERTLARDPPSAPAELQSLRSLLDREMDRLRGFIHQLRPLLGDDAGLQGALVDMAEKVEADSGTAVELSFEAPERLLDERRRAAVLRIAQEAFRNVQKHAGAKRICLTTRLEPSVDGDSHPTWVLEVRDDGRGFVIDEALSVAGRRHFGLRFMRERARLIGATLEIDSTPAQGTTVRLKLDTGEESKAWP